MDVNSISTGATSVLDNIPKVIVTLRNFLTGIFPNSYFTLVIAIISLVVAFFWVKQFVSSGFLKFSILLNIILLALLIFTLIVYVG